MFEKNAEIDTVIFFKKILIEYDLNHKLIQNPSKKFTKSMKI